MDPLPSAPACIRITGQKQLSEMGLKKTETTSLTKKAGKGRMRHGTAPKKIHLQLSKETYLQAYFIPGSIF